jgi:hypothetical protein
MSKILYPVHTQRANAPPKIKCPGCKLRLGNTSRGDQLCGNCAYWKDKAPPTPSEKPKSG